MKKKFLTVLFPVILTIACSLAVWANEQAPVHPGCNNCAKVGKMAEVVIDAKDANAVKGCGNCANAIQAEEKSCCGKAQQIETNPSRNRANDN